MIDNLADRFETLSAAEKRTVHLVLCRHALTRWREFCAGRPPIHYVESVVGTGQTVDPDLPADAVESARAGRDLQQVAARYREPIAAMQDDDLTFPEAITFAYYAIYNLFGKYAESRAVDDWLIVNQALAAEQEESRWRPLLAAAIAQAA